MSYDQSKAENKAPVDELRAAIGAEGVRDAMIQYQRAMKQGARIVCTQELFRSAYFCQSEDHENFKLAEPIPGPSTAAFQKLAKKHSVVVIASLFEKRASGATARGDQSGSGSHSSCTANTSIAIIPSQKTGTDEPITATTWPRASTTRRGNAAPMHPSVWR
jgi:predicted amidohydrolase